MKVWKYGSYEEYLLTQKETTRRKREEGIQWSTQRDMAMVVKIAVAELEKRSLSLPLYLFNVICHGVRSGMECYWMANYLKRDGQRPSMVIGSELESSEINYAVFTHDFNEYKKDWSKRFSLVYSNSFDHAYDPEATLQIWLGQLHHGGIIILEHTRYHLNSTATDPVGGTVAEYEELFHQVGCRHIDTGEDPDSDIEKKYFVLGRREDG